MDIPAMFRRAVAEFDARVRQIGDHQWQAATPDEDWAVRDLVNHLAGEDLWAPLLLAGSTIAEVGDRFEGDVLGAEPKAAWTLASAGAVRAVEDSNRRPRAALGSVLNGNKHLETWIGTLLAQDGFPHPTSGRRRRWPSARLLRVPFGCAAMPGRRPPSACSARSSAYSSATQYSTSVTATTSARIGRWSAAAGSGAESKCG